MAYTFTRTGAQIEEIHNTVDDLPSIVSNENLISNSSFEIAGSVTNPPDSTPRSYNAGDELFQGIFAVSALTGVTYIDGKANGTGQLYTDVYKSEKQKLSTANYVASIANSNGSPVEIGASFVDIGDYWRVTFDMSDTFSVKLEQGSVATGHGSKSLFDIYGDPRLTKVADVRAFGASCVDGVDDTQAWEDCRDFCLSSPSSFVFFAPQGPLYLPNGVNLYGLLNVQIEGNIISDLESNEILIGSNVIAANPSKYLLKNGNCTLKVEGMSRGHVEFLRFERLHLFATNETGVTTTRYNVSYSNFYFTEVDQFLMETNTISGTTAWMNENKFFGARIRESLTMTGDYPMNNNAFYGFKMEGITITLDAYNGSLGAHSNTWHDTRFEFNMTFNFGVGTFNNTFINTWANFSFVGFVGRNAGNWTINDLGENNDIVTMQHTYTDAETIFDLNSDSANYKWDHFEKQGNQLKNRKTFTPFMDTGLIPLDNPIWFVIETDANNIFNYFVEIFDDNGNRIYEDLNVVQAGLQWNDTFDYYDTSGVAAGGYEISIRKTTGVGFFRLWCRTAGGTLDELMTYWRCRSIQKKRGNRNIPLLPYFGRQDNFFGTSVPTYGTFTKGDIVENSAPAVGQPSYWKCVTSGTFSSASATGGTTTGNIGNNRAQISNLSDTSGFKVGDYIMASSGFAAGDLRIISIDSPTSLTVHVTSNSAETEVLIETVDPLFGLGPNLS